MVFLVQPLCTQKDVQLVQRPIHVRGFDFRECRLPLAHCPRQRPETVPYLGTHARIAFRAAVLFVDRFHGPKCQCIPRFVSLGVSLPLSPRKESVSRLAKCVRDGRITL